MKNRMRVLRAEMDWTQADLAAKTGVSRQAIIAVENGKYDPALPLAFRIARAFGTTVEKVFLWEEDLELRRTCYPPPRTVSNAPRGSGGEARPVNAKYPSNTAE
jgi:putative transcriptional regulator